MYDCCDESSEPRKRHGAGWLGTARTECFRDTGAQSETRKASSCRDVQACRAGAPWPGFLGAEDLGGARKRGDGLGLAVHEPAATGFVTVHCDDRAL